MTADKTAWKEQATAPPAIPKRCENPTCRSHYPGHGRPSERGWVHAFVHTANGRRYVCGRCYLEFMDRLGRSTWVQTLATPDSLPAEFERARLDAMTPDQRQAEHDRQLREDVAALEALQQRLDG